MTTLEILQEVKAVREKQTKNRFLGIKVIKTIYTVAYIICAVLLAYVCFDSPVFANENNPLLGGIAVTMVASFFYFVLRLSMSKAKEYGAGRLVWRYIVTAIMTVVFLIVLFAPQDSPDIVITNVTKEFAIGRSAIEVSGIVLYFVMVGLAVASHIICVVLWNKSDDLFKVQQKCIEKLESLSDKPLTWSECYDIVENLDYCIARSPEYPNKSAVELTPDAIERAIEEQKAQISRDIASRPYTPPTTEEKLLDEISDLKDEASKLNDQLKDLKDELDRYK